MKRLVILFLFVTGRLAVFSQSHHVQTMESKFNRQYWSMREREQNAKTTPYSANQGYTGGISYTEIKSKLERERLAREKVLKELSIKANQKAFRDKHLLPKYDSYTPINEENNLILINKNGLVGLYNDRTLTEIIPPKYEQIDAEDGNWGMRFVGVKTSKGKWAVYDTFGNKGQITEEKYDKVFNGHWVAAVRLDNKWGLIDNEGKEIVPMVFEDIMPTDTRLVPIPINLKGKWGFYDFNTGMISTPEFDRIVSYEGEKAKVQTGNHVYEITPKHYFSSPAASKHLHIAVLRDYDYVELTDFRKFELARARRGTKWGFVTKEGIAKTPFQYDEVSIFFSYGDRNYAKASLEGKVGLINESFEIAFPFGKYDDIKWVWNDLLIVSANNKHGAITIGGHEVIPLHYDDIRSVQHNCFIVTKDGKKGLYTWEGTKLTEPQFDDITQFSSFFKIKKENKWGLLNIKDQHLVQPVYDDIQIIRYLPPNHYLVSQNDKWGVINSNGVTVVPIKYDKLTPAFGDDFFLHTRLGNNKGLIRSSDWVELIPPVYQEFEFNISDSKRKGVYRRVWLNRKVGLLNDTGDIAIPVEYDAIDMRVFLGFEKGPIATKKNDKWGFVNEVGTVVVPFIYDMARNFDKNGKAMVRLNNKALYINRHGKKVKK